MKKYAGVTSVEEAASSVAIGLRASGLDEEAAEVERLLGLIHTSSERRPALEKLHGMCHIKWLGDLQVTSIKLQPWLELLSALKAAATAALGAEIAEGNAAQHVLEERWTS